MVDHYACSEINNHFKASKNTSDTFKKYRGVWEQKMTVFENDPVDGSSIMMLDDA